MVTAPMKAKCGEKTEPDSMEFCGTFIKWKLWLKLGLCTWRVEKAKPPFSLTSQGALLLFSWLLRVRDPFFAFSLF